jgi:hypothetical protein
MSSGGKPSLRLVCAGTTIRSKRSLDECASACSDVRPRSIRESTGSSSRVARRSIASSSGIAVSHS